MRKTARSALAVLGLTITARAGAQAPAQLSARLDSALQTLEAKGFSGVVRIDENGSTLLEKGYGLANRATKLPFSPATPVQIGSNTKDFTVVALLQLQERGKLNLNDSLSKYFPTAPADKRNITLSQLVNHTAGYPIGFGGDFDQVSRAELIERAMTRPLLFPPGTRRQYSNAGYSLLAAVIEIVSGASYDEYLRDNIFRPLGMTHTGLLLPGFDDTRLAHGYRGTEDLGTMLARPHAADGPYWNLRGNGGILSTVDDMHAFYRALFETDKLLKPQTRALRFDPNAPVGLAGSDLVSSFLYERLPGRRLEMIFASNSSEFRERAVREAVAGILGLPSVGGGPVLATAAPRKAATPPAPAVASLLRDFVETVNGGDVARLTAFIAEHFTIEPGSPTAAQRAARFGQMHGNLGTLSVTGLDQQPDGVVEVSATSAVEGPMTLRVTVANGKIQGVQVLVGG